MYKALTVQSQRCTKKKITLRCIVIGACIIHYATLDCSVKQVYATVESSVMFCITIQTNVTQKLNCACAYNHKAERNLLILLLLRTTLAPYWQSLVHLNCACFITIRYYYTRSRKSKWPELVAKYQVQWTRIMMNTRLDSSVRIKARIRTEVT